MIPRHNNWHVPFVNELQLRWRMKATARTAELRRRSSSARKLRKQVATWLAAGAISVGASCHWSATARAELPTGADIVAGSAIINAAGPVMDVNANSTRTIINWTQFNVGAGNTANFNLPDASSAILNRVTTPEMPSLINGALNSNGHVMLVNPSGIMLGASGIVNTNSFTASTFDISNDKFMAGGALTFSGDSAASIVNDGTINTGAGGAHLIANRIANSGTITSVGGNITLSGGGSVTLNNGVTYVQPTLDTLTSGISPTAGLIQNSGTIRATGAATSGGEVYLVNPNGKILHDGTIAADKSADGSLTRFTTGGRVQLEADDITLIENSSIDATGTSGGGEVLVGGDWQGGGVGQASSLSADHGDGPKDSPTMTQATTVTMQAGAIIDASATKRGDGGTIVLWSDITNVESVTKAFGTLLAKAGELAGNGGDIETSGSTIQTDDISVNASAANGNGGLWLIDPYNYVIDAVAAGNIVGTLNTGTSVTVTTTANSASQGSSGNNTDLGDITITSDIITGAMTGDATLTLQADRHVALNDGIIIDATQNGNTNELNVKFWADQDDSGDGINIVGGSISTNGGQLEFGNGNTATIGGVSTLVGGDVYINGLSAQTIDTEGGDVTVRGESIFANSGGVTIDSGGGDIDLQGLLNSGNQYEYIDGPDGQANSWDWSRTDAINGTGGGSALGDSYLVTIGSRLENAIAGFASGYRGAWIGAYRDTATPNDWKWIDGPEAGQHFFTQVGGGGNAESGWYSNFGPSEPNGTGTGGETRGQFFGDAGLWNDLGPSTSFAANQDSQYNVLGYVRETNLAPTALVIDADSGSVNVSGGVGGSKALASLSVTASSTMINGNALVTTGAQSYSSGLTATSTMGLSIDGTTLTTEGVLDVTVNGNIALGASLNSTGNVSITGDTIALSGNQSIAAGSGDVTLTVDAISGGVLSIDTTGTFTFAPNAATWTNIGTELGVTGSTNSDIFTGTNDVDWLQLENVSTLGGLTLGNATNTSRIKISEDFSIAGAINLHASEITLDNNLISAATSGTGVRLSGSEIVQNAGVKVTTNGADIHYVASGLSATASNDYPIEMNGSGGSEAIIDAAGGNISLNASFDATGVSGGSDRAMSIGNAEIKTSGSGTITIAGDATNNVNTGNTWGMQFYDSVVQTESGTINITGTGGKLSGNSRGVAVDGSSLKVLSESGAITIRDLQASGLTGNYNGLYLRPNGSTEIQIGADGSMVANSTSDITIEADRATFADTGGFGTTFNTSGDVVIESTGGSFANAVDLSKLSITGTPASLRLGKGGNTTGITIGEGFTTNGTQTFHAPLTLAGDATFTTTNSIMTFDGTVNSDGTARSLETSTGTGATIFDGDVGSSAALSSLTISGVVSANADITSTGAQSYGDTLTIGGSGTRTLSASSITTDDVSAGARDFILEADSFAIGGEVTGTGRATLNSQTVGADLGVGTTSSTVDIDNSTLNAFQDGFASITVGETNSGSLTVSGLTTLSDDLTLRAGTGEDLFVSGDINWTSNNALTLAAGDDIWVNADIDVTGAAGSLNLFYGGTDGTAAPDFGDSFFINIAGRKTIDFSDTTANLKIGNEAFTLIDSVPELIGMTAGDRYALTTDLDLSGTTYSDAVYDATFTGKFDGLGHVADGMVIRNSDGGNLGLFAELNGSTVRHLGITNYSIVTNSSVDGNGGSEYRVGGLAGNVGGAGTAVSSVTTLDGIWSSGVLSTQTGSRQKFFFGGGLIGSQNGGTMNLSRSFTTANVSSEGSYSDNLGIGGVIGDIGINTHLTSHTQTTNSVVAFDMNNIYSTGSVVLGDHGAYFGAGGLVGVVFSGGNSFADSYSWSNVVGSGSFGGIAGFAAAGSTFDRVYTTQSTFGANGTYYDSYTGSTLAAATSNGAVLPSTWLASTWSVGDQPTLNSLPIPPEQLYIRVGTGTSSIYGDALGLTYQVVDSGGSVVSFGVGDYANLSGVAGSGNFTLSTGTTTGTYNSVSYLSGLSLTGADSNLFTLNPFSTSGSHSITARTITAVLGTSGATKVYDGTAAGPSGFNPSWSFDNIVSGDSGSIAFTGSIFNDSTVALGNQLTLSGLSLSGITSSNGATTSDYALSNTFASAAATITAKPLVVSGIFANDKIYNGSTAATINTSSAVYSGRVVGDDVSVTSATGVFTNKNVGTNIPVTLSGLGLTGDDSSNYTFTPPSGLAADITAKAITVSGITATNRVYNGSTSVTVDLSGVTFGGIVSGDTLTASSTVGAFDNNNVGADKTVTLSGTTYGGTDVGNYSFTDQATATADITAKAITITGLVANDRVYDGTTTTTVDHSGVTFGGIVSGDNLTAGSTSGVFADKNVGSGKIVTLSGTVYGGDDVGNYSFTDQTSSAVDISQKAVTVTGITVNDRVYDGTTMATVDHSGVTFSGIVGGDDLTASATSGVFNDKNVGTGKTVALSGTTYGGTDVGNYSFTDQTSTTAKITEKAIIVGGITASDRQYDGTTVATVNHGGVTFGGIVSGDNLTASNTAGAFDDKNVAAGKTVTLSGTTYGGTDVGNYSFTDQATTTADISQKKLTIGGLVTNDKIYDGSILGTVDMSGITFNGLVSGDDVTLDTVEGRFANKNVGTNKLVYLSAADTGGADEGNYRIFYDALTRADITPKSITVNGIIATDRVYDGTTTATVDHSGVTFSGKVNGDNLTAGNTTGIFNNKNVGIDKTVTLSGTTFGGTDVGNYTFTEQATTLADVTQKSVTVSGLFANDRIYDGTTAATVNHHGVSFNGMISGDDLTVADTIGTFDSKHVGSGKTVTLSGTTYGGADVNNYSFTDQASTTANVSQASITISGITAADRTYDGTTAATVDLSGVTFGGIVSGDDLTAASTTGVFSDKNAAASKTVTLSGTTYSGADVNNYSFTDQASTTADISQKSIFVSGITANNRIYDGTTAAMVDLNGVAFNGIVSGDDLTASATIGTFADKHVGHGKSVTLSGTSYSGTDIANYSITDQAATTASISKQSITVSGLVANNRIYDGTALATIDHSGVTFGGMVAGDDLTASLTSGVLADKGVDTGKTVTLSGTSYGGSDVGNYSFTDQSTATVDISQKSITVSGITANNRVYDGTTTATVDLSGVTFGGIVSGDDLTAASTTGVFSNKNAAASKTVTLSGTTYSGADVNNYSFTDQASTAADITQKPITISGLVANDRVYDGSTVTTVDHSGVTFHGLISGDDLTAYTTIGTFDNKNVGTDKDVTLTATTYGGADAGNYSITDQTMAVASISRLGSVIWIGGATGDWSNPANWAGGAIPDLANVAEVTIPTGVTPILDSNVAGPVDIDSLTGGNFQIDSGTLNVAQNATGDGYTQNGGSVNVGGNFRFNPVTVEDGSLDITGHAGNGTFVQNGGTIAVGGNLDVIDYEQYGGTLGIGGQLDVTNSFYQSPNGAIDVIGDVDIMHTTGDLTIGNLSGHNLNFNSTNGSVHLGDIDAGGTLDVTAGNGGINQLAGNRINVTGTATFNATGDVMLTNSDNDFAGHVNARGNNVAITDGNGGMTLGDITTVGTFDATSTDGPILQDASGTMTIGGGATFHATAGGFPADILLNGTNNDFHDVFNADGRNIAVVDAHGGIQLGTIRADNDFGVVSTDGPITQTPHGGVQAGGESYFVAEENGKAGRIVLNNAANNFGGKVSLEADTFELNDLDGHVPLGAVRSPSMDKTLEQNSSTAARDTNTRYTNENDSGTGILNVIRRYGPQWMSQLANWMFGNAEGDAPVITEDALQTVGGEVFLRPLADSDGQPSADRTTAADEETLVR